MPTQKQAKTLPHPQIYKFKKETCIKMTRMRRKQINKRLAWRTFSGHLKLPLHHKRLTLVTRAHLQARLPKGAKNLTYQVQCALKDLHCCLMTRVNQII